MNQKTTSKPVSALIAVLFLTLTLSAIIPVASGSHGGAGASVEFSIDGASVAEGGTFWMQGDAIEVTLALDDDELQHNVYEVSLGLVVPTGGSDAEDLAFANVFAPDGWTHELGDEDGSNSVDTIVWDSVTLAATGCSQVTSCTYAADGDVWKVSLTPPAAPSEFDPVTFRAAWLGNSGYGDDDPEFMLGLDVTDPVIDSFALAGGSNDATNYNGAYTDLSGFQINYDVSDARSGVESIQYVQTFNGEAAAPVALPAWTGTAASLDLSNLADGTYSYVITATDKAGNSATSATPIDFVVDTTDPTLSAVTIESSNADDSTKATIDETITVSWTASEDLSGVTGTIGGKTIALAADKLSASVVVDNTFTDNADVSFSLVPTDLAGNDGVAVTTTNDGSSVGIAFGDLVKTSVFSVGDEHIQKGQSTLITTQTIWDELAPGGNSNFGDPYSFGEITMWTDGANPITKISNSQGKATFSVTDSDEAVHTYTFAATGFDPDANRVVAESGDAQQIVTFGDLYVHSFSVDATKLGLGTDVKLSIAINDHTDAPAEGLDVSAMLLDAEGQGRAYDAALGTVADTSGQIGGFVESTDVPGTYEVSYNPGKYESLKFTMLSGPVIVPGGASTNDGDTTYTLAPPTTTHYVHWIGAYIADVSFENLDDPVVLDVNHDYVRGDLTGDFVNLGDEVRITVDAVYTNNYDPVAENGVAIGDPASIADGSTISLYETGFLDATWAQDAISPVSNGFTSSAATTGGEATFDVTKDTFSQALLRNGANEYTLKSLVTAFDGLTQDVDSADAALDDDSSLVFTALDVLQTAAATPSIEDIDSDGRWWLAMDNAKGDTDADPTDTDSIDVQYNVRWAHNGLLMHGATVQVDVLDSDPASRAFLDNADGTYTATFYDAAVPANVNQYYLDLDPDAFDLDAKIQNWEIVAVHAMEPNSGGMSITESGETEVEELVWTRVAAIMDFNGNNDGEIDLGTSTEMYNIPVYYHDELGGASGPGYYFDADFTKNDAWNHRIIDGGTDGTFYDASASGLTTADSLSFITDPANSIASVDFEVFAGCDAPATRLNSQATVNCIANPAEAGWHTYTADLTTVPHGLPHDDASKDVLFTAVVIDSWTDRLTQEIGSDIELSAQAYYAHTKDLAGNDIADVPYIMGLTADIEMLDTGVEGTAALIFDNLDMGTAGSLTKDIMNSAAGHYDIQVVDAVLGEETTTDNPQPLTLAYESAVLERVWLEAILTLAGGSDAANTRTDFTDRNLQIRGDDVEVFFDVIYTDGGPAVEVVAANPGYVFTATDTNDKAPRFNSGPLATTVDMTPATVWVSDDANAATTFPATYQDAANCDGADNGCWMATISGFTAVNLESFDIGAELKLTMDSAHDMATMLSANLDQAFDVQFTAVELEVLTAGNEFYQADRGVGGQDTMGEFWYNLGDDATFDVAATWAHNDAPATGATLWVEDPGAGGSNFATVIEALDAQNNPTGVHAVSFVSPAASELRTYKVAVESIPSLETGEAGLVEALPFAEPEAGLTWLLAKPDIVHTQVVFDWVSDIDGTHINKGQAATFDYTLHWAHVTELVDEPAGLRIVDGTSDHLTTFTDTNSYDTFELTRAESGVVIATPVIVDAPGVIEAPRGIGGAVYGAQANGAELIWTAIKVDVDSDQPANSYTVGDTALIGARGSLEHDATNTFLEHVGLSLFRTGQVTTATGYLDGSEGSNLGLTALTPSTITVIGQGVSYTPVKSYNGDSISSSVDDSIDVTFFAATI